MKKFLALFISLTMAVVVFSGCAKKEADTIKIGVFEPLTGPNAGGGQLEYDGIKLANKLRGEVLGKKVELVVADNKSDKVEAATAASRLVEQDKVVAVLGSWGSQLSIAAGDTLKNAKIPAIACSATSPLVTKGNEFYFRVCFIDPYQGQVMANYATKDLSAKTAAIIVEKSSDYSIGLAKYFEESFKKLTGNTSAIVARGEYVTGDTDFNAQLANIAATKPDVIFAPGNFTESALIVKQARQLKIDVPILGGDTWETPEFIKVGGKDVENKVWFSTFFDPSAELTPNTKKFVEAFNSSEFAKDDKGEKKEPAAVTALSFEAYNLLLDSIEKAGTTDGQKLRDTINAAKDYPGVTGFVTFDEDRNAKKEAVIKKVENGNFKYSSSVKAE